MRIQGGLICGAFDEMIYPSLLASEKRKICATRLAGIDLSYEFPRELLEFGL
jgi:hypothetical protein